MGKARTTRAVILMARAFAGGAVSLPLTTPPPLTEIADSARHLRLL
jgi:hypothetical protein